MASKSSGISLNKFEIKLMNAGKGLLLLPTSTVEIRSVLQQMERLLARVQVQPLPSESMKYAMQPVIEALIAKELVSHHDLDVNISVGCCISEVLRIMDRNAPYNDKQMKDFIQLSVITFKKLSSTSGGCYNRMTKVLRTLSRVKFSVLMSDRQLDRLIVRLFKQFLTDADSNSAGVVSKMKKIMTIIIEQSELINPELVDLLVKSVKKENQIDLPICGQLAEKVLNNCAAQLNSHLPDNVEKEFYGSSRESIPCPIHKRKLEGIKNTLPAVRQCQEETRNSVKVVGIHSEIENNNINENEKKPVLFDDSSMPTKDVTQTNNSGMINVRGYNVKQNIATILEAIFKKHGDIAAECVFKADSSKTYFLGVVCEIVRQINNNDVSEKMEEIECQVSDAEAANINVLWLRAHLEAMYKRNEAIKRLNLITEMEEKIVLVKRAAQMDLRERSAKLVVAQQRFEKAEKCVRVLHLVEKKLNDNILESENEKDSWVKELIL